MNSKHDISPVLVAVTLLIAVALVVFGYMQWGRQGRAAEALQAEGQQLELARQQLQTLQGLAAREQELTEKLALLEQLMPLEAKDEQLILDMQSGADLSALRFMVIRFGERAAAEGFSTLPLNLSFEGRFHGLLNLLEYILAYERAVRLQEVLISAVPEVGEAAPPQAAQQGAGPLLSVQINGSAFFSAE